MIKVFLVEDEFVVREGIKNNIDWKAHGYEFCGEASDGELALPMIKKEMPDIVITDIKMPFMDGLELSRALKRELPDTEIIILSGYEEFEYAKEAIRLGVAQYLTKPITGEDLIKELDVLAARIDEKNKEKALKEQFRKEMKENDKSDKRELFHKMVSGKESATSLINSAQELGINLSAMWYNIVLLWSKSEHHQQEEYSGSSVLLEDRLEKFAENTGFMIFDRNLEGKALLFVADSEEELNDKISSALAVIERELKKYSHIRYFGGIGKAVNRLSNLVTSYENACRAVSHRYFILDNQIIGSEDEIMLPVEKEVVDIKDFDLKSFDRHNLLRFLRTGNSDEVKFFVNEYIACLGENSVNSVLFRQYIAMDAYLCAVTVAKEIVPDVNNVNVEAFDPQSMDTIESAVDYIVRIISSVIALRESASNNKNNVIVEDTIKYIEDRYSDYDLSLNELASNVNVSPNHLSTIFAQQTGRTFIKYLTDYRINKAKELLKCTNLRSNEISEKVGYQDPHYFSYLFKKTVGMTPTQYRGDKE